MGDKEKVYCVECDDVEAALRCPECGNDAFCGLCYKYLHRRGTRQHHHPVALPGVDIQQHLQPCRGTTDAFVDELSRESSRRGKKLSREEKARVFEAALSVGDAEDTQYNTAAVETPVKKPEAQAEKAEEQAEEQEQEKEQEKEEEKASSESSGSSSSSSSSSSDGFSDSDSDSDNDAFFRRLYKERRTNMYAAAAAEDEDEEDFYGDAGGQESFATWVPMRLLPEERELLQTLEGVLEVSEYTDKVDVSFDYFGWRTGGSQKAEIIDRELEEVLHLVLGMCVAGNYAKGKRLLERELADNVEFFQTVFEIGRRYKVMNPDKMRTTYGKLMHMLMDLVENRVLGVDRVRPILTVRRFLESRCGAARAQALLQDARLAAATAVVVVQEQERVAAADVAARIERKRVAREALVAEYGTAAVGGDAAATGLSAADVERVLASLEDANSYLVSNRDPVDRMLEYLGAFFSAAEPSADDVEAAGGQASLAIAYGRGGSCLSHSHATQYEFVRQTLLLWREIQTQMFKLWVLADGDLLAGGRRYRLANTGQGLNRMKSAPGVARAMSQILARVQGAVRGGWVGLSVVHLGDYDVPNALFFIDKYTQVPRILAPLVHAVDRIDVLARDPRAAHLVALAGGADQCRRRILRDYFRHGFDGSGSDGGSCVDGRLTSSWNWCSLVEKKSYYPILLATGFTGFDGSFS